MNEERAEKLIYRLLLELGEDPEREGLKDTPKRVIKLYKEMLEGLKYTNDDLVKMFDKTFGDDVEEEANLIGDYNDMVLVRDIEVFSFCEHHMSLMYNMKINVAYIPTGKIIGLSKIARICDMVAKRLQVQERIGRDIAYIINRITGSEDVAVIIEGYHSCMTARGIKNNNSKTVTSTVEGKFMEHHLRSELMTLLNKE